jgi:hypothetical protein
MGWDFSAMRIRSGLIGTLERIGQKRTLPMRHGTRLAGKIAMSADRVRGHDRAGA